MLHNEWIIFDMPKRISFHTQRTNKTTNAEIDISCDLLLIAGNNPSYVSLWQQQNENLDTGLLFHSSPVNCQTVPLETRCTLPTSTLLDKIL